MAAKIAWATDLEGIYRHVKEVANGKSCNCRCPECGEPLIACHPNPIVKTSYFAHYSNTACNGESILHKIAKRVLQDLAHQQVSITLPENSATVYGIDILGNDVESTHHEPKSKWQMNNAISEEHVGQLIVDTVATNSDGKRLGIEIYVRHKKSSADMLKFDNLPFECIEIDLSNTPWDIDRQSLEKSLLEEANRRWLTSHSLRRAKQRAERNLALITASRNQKILIEFQKQKDQIVSESQQHTIRVATLKSPRATLQNGTSISIAKRISIKNIRDIRKTSTDSTFDYVADVVVDENLANGKSINVFFLSHGEKPNIRSPYILFKLITEWQSEELQLVPRLLNGTEWRKKLNKLLQHEVRVRNAYILQEHETRDNDDLSS